MACLVCGTGKYVHHHYSMGISINDPIMAMKDYEGGRETLHTQVFEVKGNYAQVNVSIGVYFWPPCALRCVLALPACHASKNEGGCTKVVGLHRGQAILKEAVEDSLDNHEQQPIIDDARVHPGES